MGIRQKQNPSHYGTDFVFIPSLLTQGYVSEGQYQELIDQGSAVKWQATG